MHKLKITLFLSFFTGFFAYAQEEKVSEYQSFIEKGSFRLPSAPESEEYLPEIKQTSSVLDEIDEEAEFDEGIASTETAKQIRPEDQLMNELNSIFSAIDDDYDAPPKSVKIQPETPKTKRAELDQNFVGNAQQILDSHIDNDIDLPLIEIPDRLAAGTILNKSKIYNPKNLSLKSDKKLNKSAPIYPAPNQTSQTYADNKENSIAFHENLPPQQIELVVGSKPSLNRIEEEVEEIESIDEEMQEENIMIQDKVLENKVAPEQNIVVAKINEPTAELNQPSIPNISKEITDKAASTQPEPPAKQSKKSSKPIKKIDRDLMKFIRDESIFIRLKDDNVILGKQTFESELAQMDFNQYATVFKKIKYKELLTKDDKKMENFIAKHYASKGPRISKKQLMELAVDAIEKGNLSDLRILDDNYNLVDLEDVDDSNMLHIATSKDEPRIAKWLVMKGVDINAVNEDYMAPIDIAALNGRIDIFNLLKKAGAR